MLSPSGKQNFKIGQKNLSYELWLIRSAGVNELAAYRLELLGGLLQELALALGKCIGGAAHGLANGLTGALHGCRTGRAAALGRLAGQLLAGLLGRVNHDESSSLLRHCLCMLRRSKGIAPNPDRDTPKISHI
jgi:hypothetical protein